MHHFVLPVHQNGVSSAGVTVRGRALFGVTRVLLLLTASGPRVLAQDKPNAPLPKAQPEARTLTNRQEGLQNTSSEAQQGQNPKRILGIIPNFATRNDTPGARPLTVKEKYALAWHQSVDISAHFGDAFQAALEQASDTDPHYGQGWGAYAQRFGASEADQATSSFFVYGFLPHVLHDDPRYFRKPGQPVLYRLKYAATRTFITRKDSGEPTFNTPQVAGFLLQRGISTAYYPERDRTVGAVFQNWGISLAYRSAYNVLREFYPDLLHIVFRQGQDRASDPGPAK